MHTYGEAHEVVDAGYPMDAAALPVKMTADDELGITLAPPIVCGVGEVTEIVGSALTDVTETDVLTGFPLSTPETVSVCTVPTVDDTVHEMVPNPGKLAEHPEPTVPLVS